MQYRVQAQEFTAPLDSDVGRVIVIHSKGSLPRQTNSNPFLARRHGFDGSVDAGMVYQKKDGGRLAVRPHEWWGCAVIGGQGGS